MIALKRWIMGELDDSIEEIVKEAPAP